MHARKRDPTEMKHALLNGISGTSRISSASATDARSTRGYADSGSGVKSKFNTVLVVASADLMRATRRAWKDRIDESVCDTRWRTRDRAWRTNEDDAETATLRW